MNEKMTLEEFFALADRVAGALNVLREARGLTAMHSPISVPSQWTNDIAHGPPPVITYTPAPPVALVRPVTNKGAIQWTPKELARKEDLRQKQAETMPVDPVMAAMEASDDS